MPDAALALCASLWREEEGGGICGHRFVPDLWALPSPLLSSMHRPKVSHSSSHPVISKGPSPHHHQIPGEMESAFVPWGYPNKGHDLKSRCR